jgi:glycosyltransferase involved in cell wall biosynthesis
VLKPAKSAAKIAVLAAPALSIVLPAYNEEGNLERAVREADAAASRLVSSHEILVVDDGSRDRSSEILAKLAGELGDRLRVVRHDVNRGYGAALRDGFAASRGELVFYTDSDNQFDLGELREFLPLMKDNDVVLGYRVNRQDPWLRKFVSGVFNGLSSFVFGMSVRDLNCSFKLFRGPVIRDLVIESNDFFVDTEIVARLHRAGYRYTQKGVTHFPRMAGHSTVRPSDVPRTLVSIVRMRGRIRATPPRS